MGRSLAHDDGRKQLAEESKRQLTEAELFGKPLVTPTTDPAPKFWPVTAPGQTATRVMKDACSGRRAGYMSRRKI